VILVIIATGNVFASPSQLSCTDTVYATTLPRSGEATSLAVSTDEGETWTTRDLPAPLDQGLWSIAANGDALYAVASMSILYVTHNQGKTWKRLTIPTSLPDGRNANVIYVAGNRVYVGAYADGGRFAISDDNGETWPINVRLSPDWRPGTFSGYEVNAIHASNGRAYIGTRSKGVGISEDDGKTWRFVGAGPFSEGVSVIAGFGDKVYVGYGTSDGTISISEDGGKSWRLQKTNEENRSVSSIAAINDKVYATHGGPYLSISSDGGKRWARTLMPIRVEQTYSVVVSGNNVYVGTSEGVVVSRDGGDTWSLIQLRQQPIILVYGFAQCV